MAERQRILYLAKDWALDGAERQLCYLVGNLDPSRFVPVVLTDRDGPLTAHLRTSGVEVHVLPLPGWRRLGYFVFRYMCAWRATRLAQLRGVALVHASDLWKSQYALFIAHRLGIPGVVHVRGPFLARDTAKHGLDRADGVIAIAERYAGALRAAGVAPERIAQIDDAVDLQRFSPAVCGAAFRQRWGVGARLAVGLVGRLDPFKRVLDFLEMAAAADRVLPEAALYLLIGKPGPPHYWRAINQAIARLGLAGRVIQTGRLDAMPEAMAGLDILATWSGGSVMFEAMASGKVVLSVRPEGQRSVPANTIHNQTAWCITTAQPAVAATALVQLLQDAPLRQRLGQAARQHVEEHLAPERLAQQTVALYDRLLSGSTTAKAS